MTIVFIVNMNEDQKAGLFNATHNRIKNVKREYPDLRVLNIVYEDSVLIKVLKKMLKKKMQSNKEYFIYDEIKYQNLRINGGVLSRILQFIGFDFSVFNTLLKKNLNYFKDIELISAHWGYPQGGIARAISKNTGIPYVVTLHGSDIHSINNIIYRKKTLKVLEDAQKAIFVSEFLRQKAIEMGYKNKNSTIIYNAINLDKFFEVNSDEIKKRKESIGAKNKIVGFIGNLVSIKRADELVEIFNNINARYVDCSFLVVGNGPYLEDLKEEAILKGVNVHFTHHVEPDMVNEWMNIIDILVLPSREEGFGLVILEANAVGTLAIGSNIGGIPEAIGNSELLVDEGNNFIEEISEKIAYYLINGYQKENVKKRVHERFSNEILAENEVELYKNIIS